MDVHLSTEWQSLNIHPLAERNDFCLVVFFSIYIHGRGMNHGCIVKLGHHLQSLVAIHPTKSSSFTNTSQSCCWLKCLPITPPIKASDQVVQCKG